MSKESNKIVIGGSFAAIDIGIAKEEEGKEYRILMQKDYHNPYLGEYVDNKTNKKYRIIGVGKNDEGNRFIVYRPVDTGSKTLVSTHIEFFKKFNKPNQRLRLTRV